MVVGEKESEIQTLLGNMTAHKNLITHFVLLTAPKHAEVPIEQISDCINDNNVSTRH